MTFPYPTGAASLFSTMARQAPEPEVVIPCPWCLSDDTEMEDHEHDIYRCLNCGETFERSIRPATPPEDGD